MMMTMGESYRREMIVLGWRRMPPDVRREVVSRALRVYNAQEGVGEFETAQEVLREAIYQWAVAYYDAGGK